MIKSKKDGLKLNWIQWKEQPTFTIVVDGAGLTQDKTIVSDATLAKCKQECIKLTTFSCASFNFDKTDKTCTLSKGSVAKSSNTEPITFMNYKIFDFDKTANINDKEKEYFNYLDADQDGLMTLSEWQKADQIIGPFAVDEVPKTVVPATPAPVTPAPAGNDNTPDL